VPAGGALPGALHVRLQQGTLRRPTGRLTLTLTLALTLTLTLTLTLILTLTLTLTLARGVHKVPKGHASRVSSRAPSGRYHPPPGPQAKFDAFEDLLQP
jgi:hypothetical protein